MAATVLTDPSRRAAWRRLAAVPIASLVAAGLTPLGPTLLLVPFDVRSSAAAYVNEWQTPALTNPLLWAALVAALIVALRCLRSPRRHLPSLVIGAAGFALAVYSVRTIAFGAILLALALAMAGAKPDVMPSRTGAAEYWPLATACVAFALVPGVIWGGDTTGPLATRVDTAIAALPVGSVVAVEPFSANWVVWRHRHVVVLKDLRAEIYSEEVVADYQDFMEGETGWESYAQEQAVTAVVAENGSGIDTLLARDATWRQLAHDETHAVWVSSAALRAQMSGAA